MRNMTYLQERLWYAANAYKEDKVNCTVILWPLVYPDPLYGHLSFGKGQIRHRI
jgi:hypothetical protein